MSTILQFALVLSALCFAFAVENPTQGERCHLPDNCTPPLSCVGKPTNFRCFMKKELGMNCGKDPFWVCVDGLLCDDGTCKRPIGRSGRCDDDPLAVCQAPFSCVGKPENRRCFKKRPLGRMCKDDPFWNCEDGLICDDNICKTPIEAKGRCDNEPLAVCNPPLSCVGKVGNMRCHMKKPLGMRCKVDPFWVCEDGLICDDNICKTPIDKKGRCDADALTACNPPLSCVGNTYNRRCFQKKPLGMRCGKDPFWVCEDGLICKDNICEVAH